MEEKQKAEAPRRRGRRPGSPRRRDQRPRQRGGRCRHQPRFDSLKKRGADGDYQVKEMNEVLNRETSIGRLYESVEKPIDKVG